MRLREIASPIFCLAIRFCSVNLASLWQTGKKQIGRAQYAGIFLISLATLLLELALTRVLSVALWYHFGFLVISTALLGFGSSGVVLAVWTRLRDRVALAPALTWLSLSFGVVAVASFWLMQPIPFDPFSLFSDRRQLIFMPVVLPRDRGAVFLFRARDLAPAHAPAITSEPTLRLRPARRRRRLCGDRFGHAALWWLRVGRGRGRSRIRGRCGFRIAASAEACGR